MTASVLSFIALFVKLSLVVIPVAYVTGRSRNFSATELCAVVTFAFLALPLIAVAAAGLPPLPLPWLPQRWAEAWHSAAPAVVTVLGIAYAAGVLAKLVRLAVDLRRLRVNALVITAPALLAAKQEALAAMGVRKQVHLLTHPAIGIPMTWGGSRPVIALPEAALAWPLATTRRVLLHEAAHIVRGDALSNIAVALVDALLWCVPTRGLLLTQLHWYREIACDDKVLATGVTRSDYARDLLALSQTARGALPQAIALIEVSHYYRRIDTVLAAGRVTVASGHRWLWVAGVIAVAFIMLGALQLVAPSVKAPRGWVTHSLSEPTEPAHTLQPVVLFDGYAKPARSAMPALPATPSKTPAWTTADLTLEPVTLQWHTDVALPRHLFDAPAELLQPFTPNYPHRALQRGAEGSVEVTFDILPSGQVVNVALSKAHRVHALNRAALAAVAQYRYQPRIEAGRPVTSAGVKEIFVFQIIEDAK